MMVNRPELSVDRSSLPRTLVIGAAFFLAVVAFGLYAQPVSAMLHEQLMRFLESAAFKH